MEAENNEDKKECKDCVYHNSFESGVCCMYIVATGQMRNCETDDCEKYTYASKYDRKKYWEIINNMESTPGKFNAMTLLQYRIKKLKEQKEKGEK